MELALCIDNSDSAKSGRIKTHKGVWAMPISFAMEPFWIPQVGSILVIFHYENSNYYIVGE